MKTLGIRPSSRITKLDEPLNAKGSKAELQMSKTDIKKKYYSIPNDIIQILHLAYLFVFHEAFTLVGVA